MSAAGMWNGCNDQGTTSQLPALTDQSVTWTQNGRSALLARADADPTSGQLKVTVNVPANALPGRAEVTAGIAVPAAVDVIASAPRSRMADAASRRLDPRTGNTPAFAFG